MKIRPINFDTDAKAIDKIWREHYLDQFSLPDLTNAVTFPVIEDDNGVIVAFGIVKVFAEAIIILDKKSSTRTRRNSIKMMLDKAETDCKSNNIKQLHAFCESDFADILIKHFDFKKIKTIGVSKEL